MGSGCYDATAYSAAVASARTVFDIAEGEGFHFNLLDIGGGFPGQKSAKLTFEEVSTVCQYCFFTILTHLHINYYLLERTGNLIFMLMEFCKSEPAVIQILVAVTSVTIATLDPVHDLRLNNNEGAGTFYNFGISLLARVNAFMILFFGVAVQ